MLVTSVDLSSVCTSALSVCSSSSGDSTITVSERVPSSSVISTRDRKSTRLNSSHRCISYAVFCWKKKNSGLVICGWCLNRQLLSTATNQIRGDIITTANLGANVVAVLLSVTLISEQTTRDTAPAR